MDIRLEWWEGLENIPEGRGRNTPWRTHLSFAGHTHCSLSHHTQEQSSFKSEKWRLWAVWGNSPVEQEERTSTLVQLAPPLHPSSIFFFTLLKVQDSIDSMIHGYVNSVSLDKMTSISTQAVAVLFALWVVADSIRLIYTFLAVDTRNLKLRKSGDIFCVMAKYLEIKELHCSAEQWNRMEPKAPEQTYNILLPRCTSSINEY